MEKEVRKMLISLDIVIRNRLAPSYPFNSVVAIEQSSLVKLPWSRNSFCCNFNMNRLKKQTITLILKRENEKIITNFFKVAAEQAFVNVDPPSSQRRNRSRCRFVKYTFRLG